jgi:hypothetical protein
MEVLGFKEGLESDCSILSNVLHIMLFTDIWIFHRDNEPFEFYYIHICQYMLH